MTGRSLQGAKASKLMLAVALLLVFSLAFSPFAVAAKNSDKGKGAGRQDGASDNSQATEKGHIDDNKLNGNDKGKKNQAKENKHDSGNNTPEQPDQQDNDANAQPDNNTQDQPSEPENTPDNQSENDAQGQPDNNTPEQPEDNTQNQPENDVDNPSEQPSQPDQASSQSLPAGDNPQPEINERIDQAQILENQVETVLENSAESKQTESLESVESSEQPAQDNQSLEPVEELNDRSSSQQNQAAAGITSESGVSNIGVSFSENLSLLSVGFGVFMAVKLVQMWIQRKYFSQIFTLRIQLASVVSPVYRFMGKMNPMNMHFGKIKCGAGFTKEEALAFFRECQRLPLAWDRRYM
jgi:hypothetical protein